MIQMILPDIFQLQIPLVNSPLQILNAYLIRGQARSLLIDTGFNRPECKDLIINSLETLGVNIDDVDIFLTHMHNDHCGLATEIASDYAQIFCNPLDTEIIFAALEGQYIPTIGAKLFNHGYPEVDLNFASEQIRKDISNKNHPFTDIKDGDLLCYGQYKFTCINTPGHTRGHACLYEPTFKILFSGDMLLSDISPNVGISVSSDDDLGLYLESLARIYALEIELVLPGHRSVIKNYRTRINEIELHHEKRLREIVHTLGEKRRNSFEVASLITWESKCSWNELPLYQKWFATSEVIAHLEHLYCLGSVRKIKNKDQILFELCSYPLIYQNIHGYE